MNTQRILSYLAALENNNSREWFHGNKALYAQACIEFEGLLQTLLLVLGQKDEGLLLLNPKELTFKLNRDTRFSNDKSPYNPAFRAHIATHGKLPIPVGYYLSIRSGDRSFIGGGLFASMFPEATSMVRDYISSHRNEFKEILSEKEFAEHFSVKGEALKNVPRGYDARHPQAEYLKNKSWYLEYPVPDCLIQDAPRFISEAASIFLLMRPFNNYLNKALEGFKMPER